MHRHHHGVVRVLAAGVCASALAACSGSSTGNKTSGGLPPKAVQTEVAASIASGISSEITAMTTTGFSPFLALFNRVSPGGNVPAINLAKRMTARGTRIREGTDCPTVTPAEIVDTDGDGIPDSIAEAWGSDCSDTSGGETFTIGGSLSFSDATPNTPGLAYNANIGNFEIQESGSSADLTLSINGTLGVTETLSSIGVSSNYTYNFAETSPNAVTEAITEKLTAAYSFPATSTLLVEGNALPAGTFTLSGQETFTVNNTTYAFTVSTQTPLTVDHAACPTGPTSGVVTIGFSGQGATGTVTITWTACNTYTIQNA